MFTSPKDGKRARLSLGTYPATPLAQARTLALEARSHVEAGIDPRDMGKPTEAGAMTVAMLAQSYLEMHGAELRSRQELARKMHSDVLPVIGNMHIADCTVATFTASLILSRREDLPRWLARFMLTSEPC